MVYLIYSHTLQLYLCIKDPDPAAAPPAEATAPPAEAALPSQPMEAYVKTNIHIMFQEMIFLIMIYNFFPICWDTIWQLVCNIEGHQHS